MGWTPADSSAERLNAAQMQVVGIALGLHVGHSMYAPICGMKNLTFNAWRRRLRRNCF